VRKAAEIVGREILVPGSIANLGPGFDVLAVAVRIYLRLRICEFDPARHGLEFHFPDLPPDGENYIERAFLHLGGNRPAPRLVVESCSDIPMKGGLGSSAAATVAGLRLLEAIYGPLRKRGGSRVPLARRLELSGTDAPTRAGHPTSASGASCQRSPA
jgi:homoserine kinase